MKFYHLLIILFLVSCTRINEKKINLTENYGNYWTKDNLTKILKYYKNEDNNYKIVHDRKNIEKYIVEITDWRIEKDIIIGNGKKEIIYILPRTEIIKFDPIPWNYEIMGISDDNNFVWFYCYIEGGIINYGLIDIREGKYLLFDPPEYFKYYQIQVDFNSGDALYTDFPFQGTADIAEKTKESGKIFHLYKYNFITKEIEIIDTNIGEGFLIEKINNELVYSKGDNKVLHITGR